MRFVQCKHSTFLTDLVCQMNFIMSSLKYVIFKLKMDNIIIYYSNVNFVFSVGVSWFAAKLCREGHKEAA